MLSINFRSVKAKVSIAVLASVVWMATAVAEDAPYQGGGHLTEVQFSASDGVTVFADHITGKAGAKAPLIILYHQAQGSARGEYETIVPRLLSEGYQVLAVDQRSGGDAFGAPNRTVDKIGSNAHYCEAYPDMIAALDYARGLEGEPKPFIWGSSYSAGLVIRLGAARGDDLSGVLAFSPAAGEPMAACDPNAHIKDLKVATLALRPGSEMEYESVQAQLDLFKAHDRETYVAPDGVHGSSMLVEERTEASTEVTWGIVLDFLSRHAQQK